MRDEAEIPVLRRIAGARRAAAGPTQMTAAKAMRLALAKAGDEALGAVVALRDFDGDRVLPDVLAKDLADPALFLQIDGAGLARGLIVACPQTVAALIEAQTLGQVLAVEAPARRPTRTDAALASGFLGMLLTGFAALAGTATDPPPVEGFACGAPLPDARGAVMALADRMHLRYRAEVDFGHGAKTGRLQLILPAERPAAAAGAGRGGTGWSRQLETAVLGAPARFEAVLCRIRLPIADVAGLTPGQMLPLKGATLDGVSLVGADGRALMQARLGRSGPSRALRLYFDGPPGPAGLSDVAPPPRQVASPPPTAPPAVPDPAAAGPVPTPMPAGDLPDPAAPDVPLPAAAQLELD